MNVFKRIWLMGDACYRLLVVQGLARSLWRDESTDAQGHSVPWVSYAALHFLDALDLRGAHVFEFGSGNSTFYWMQRQVAGTIKTYQALELNRDYYNNLALKSRYYREHVRCVEEINAYIGVADAYRQEGGAMFDVTIVDGNIHTRDRELEAALRITDSEGLIIVDDANWLAAQLDAVCNRLGMFRVDFVSHGPCVSYPKMTSILFRNPARFFGARIVTPIGGFAHYPGQF